MAEIALAAETGRIHGSPSSRRLRRDGRIPGIVYGHGIHPIPVSVDGRDLRHALNTDVGMNAVLRLAVDGTEHLTMARVLQRDPVRHTVTHVDFQVVRADEQLHAEVPIVLEGDAIEVRRADGVVDHVLFNLTVVALPGNIPAQIPVDISELTVGAAIRVGDLTLPAGVVTEVDPDEVIVTATAMMAAEPEPEVEGEEPVEGEPTEGAAAESGSGSGGGGGGGGGSADDS